MAGNQIVPSPPVHYYVSIKPQSHGTILLVHGRLWQLASSGEGYPYLDCSGVEHLDQRSLSLLNVWTPHGQTLVPVPPASVLFPCRLHAQQSHSWALVPVSGPQGSAQARHLLRSQLSSASWVTNFDPSIPVPRPDLHVYRASPSQTQSGHHELTLYAASVWRLVPMSEANDTSSASLPVIHIRTAQELADSVGLVYSTLSGSEKRGLDFVEVPCSIHAQVGYRWEQCRSAPSIAPETGEILTKGRQGVNTAAPGGLLKITYALRAGFKQLTINAPFHATNRLIPTYYREEVGRKRSKTLTAGHTFAAVTNLFRSKNGEWEQCPDGELISVSAGQEITIQFPKVTVQRTGGSSSKVVKPRRPQGRKPPQETGPHGK